MRTHLLAVAVLAAIPSLAAAQRGMSGMAGGARSNKEAPRLASGSEFADLNPAAALVDKRKKLALADSEVTKLKALDKTIRQRNKGILASYDSVRRMVPTPSEKPSASDQAITQDKMQSLRMIIARYMEARKVDSDEALAVVPEAKRKDAAGFIAEQDDELTQLMPGGRRY